MRKRGKKAKVRRATSRGLGKTFSARAVEEALAGVAHDIRTPLTGIVALAELLASSNLGAREREWAEALKSGADHLSGLASLIIDAVKTDASGLVLRNEPFSPRALAESVGIAFSARAGGKAIAAVVKIADDLPQLVSGDVLRLRATLENLADNAVKFTNQGTVTFTAAAEKAARGRVRLKFGFADSGIGMSAAEVKKLFRPFAQASAGIAKIYGGSGLGLSFVKRLAKAMGGDLTVASKKGGGSVFQLSTLVDAVAEPSAARKNEVRSNVHRPLAILCAEDNPYGRVVMNTILRELGHRVEFVESGLAAVTAVAEGNYDVVLMDVALSGFSGIEATRRIRALSGKKGQTPVIGISGHSQSGDEEAARASGMSSYFVKPVSPRKLAEALSSIRA
jgi:two-component system, sensor histidine kinase